MIHLKTFEGHSFGKCEELFQKIAISSDEYFNTDPDLDIDVRFFDGGTMDDSDSITIQDLDQHSKTFKQILRKHHLDLESFDDDSYAIVKLPLWKQSDKLSKVNGQVGVFENFGFGEKYGPKEEDKLQLLNTWVENVIGLESATPTIKSNGDIVIEATAEAKAHNVHQTDAFMKETWQETGEALLERLGSALWEDHFNGDYEIKNVTKHSVTVGPPNWMDSDKLNDVNRRIGTFENHHVFLYGTLKNKKLLKKVLGHNVPDKKEETRGEKDVIRTYPDLVPEKERDHKVQGNEITIDDKDLKTLDDWEERYKRRKVRLKDKDLAYYYRLDKKYE